MSQSYFREVLKNFSRRSRRKKFELFQAIFQPRPQDLILDVGVSGRLFAPYSFEDYYPYPERIIAGGISRDEVFGARERYPDSRYALFNGCALPFADKTFDIVFSNAVIEHVMGPGQRELFAREVRRVGRSWFVTTPNYWFPFEPHYHLPFIQFLPREAQRWYNRLLGTAIPKGKLGNLSLLSARELHRLFPEGRIVHVRVTFWPETLVSVYQDPVREK
jgi:SAM-dependent methyltransferase